MKPSYVPTDLKMHKRSRSSVAFSLADTFNEVFPTHLKRSIGCHVWDVQDRKFIDFTSPHSILGFCNETVNMAASEAIRDGNMLPISTRHEVFAAEKLKELLPFVDCFRFFTTESHAREFAMEVTGGRAFITRPISLQFNDEEILKLQELRKQNDVPLIFDETDTFLRFAKCSVSRETNINPDLIIIGGCMANGFPLAAVGGSYAVMDKDIPFRSLENVPASSLAACVATVELIQKTYKLDQLWIGAAKFIREFNEIFLGSAWIEGYPTRGVIKGPLVQALRVEACKAGLLFNTDFYFNFSHLEYADSVLNTCKDIITKFKVGK